MNNMKSQMDHTSKEMIIKAALRSIKIPYYPTAIETEQEVLRRFCHSIMDSKYSKRLANALLRGGIKSVNDLYFASEERIMNIRGIGETYREDIQNMKKILDEAVRKRSEELCDFDLNLLY